jgi:predicted P-loop ATPase
MLKRPDEDDEPPLSPAQKAAADTFVAKMEAADRQRQLAAARSDDWKGKLLTNGQGAPKPILANAITAFRYAPKWQDVLYFDEFSTTTMVRHSPPWEGGVIVDRKWNPKDDSLAADWLQREGITVGTNVAAEAIEVVARDAPFHPLREYLTAMLLEWDGVPRVATWLSQYLGVPHSPYAKAVGQAWMISAVARAMEPGVKADSMLIIEGSQGIGKSRAVRTLSDPWFSDELADIGSKDASLQLGGNWIFELSELGALQKSEVTKLKAFLSCTKDRFRPPYGRRVIEVPRQCIFVGTTNDNEYLKDATGARRFWPVKAGHILLQDLERDRDQLWGEAVALFQDGQPWWLTSTKVIAAARNEQEERYVADPWDDLITQYLECRNDTSIAEILGEALHLEAAKRTQVDQNRVSRCLRSSGWIKYQHRTDERREWRYRRLEL